MRKREKRTYTIKFTIILTAIMALNFIGVSYAYWTDDLSIEAQLSTTMGDINPQFCKKYLIDTVKGKGDLSVRFEDKNTMVIEGVVEPDYKAFLHYCIVNNGSVPVKFENQQDDIDEVMSIKVEQESGILRPGKNFYSDTGNPKLGITALSEGSHKKTITLPFRQWDKE